MATIKRRTLVLSTRKELKLFGNSLAINTALEFGEGGAPNIFSFFEQQIAEESAPQFSKDTEESKAAKPKVNRKNTAIVSNPYKLSASEIDEIADYNIRLWLDLKDKIREYGVGDTRIFNRDGLR
jgi:hypothetical protein